MTHDEQVEKARTLAALHIPGNPLVLYNAWDVGSARAVRDAGAPAIATGSWSVAAANGFADGEHMPLERVLDVIGRIAAAVDVPVTLDFESGYARGGAALGDNIRRVLAAGAVGINLEDRRSGEAATYALEEHAERVATARRAADATGVPLFINARTDMFLLAEPQRHAAVVDEAIARAKAYAAAGANGIFLPGIRDDAFIGRVCREIELPVNVLYFPELPPRARLAELGVARVSYGPRPYREMMAALTAATRVAMHGE